MFRALHSMACYIRDGAVMPCGVARLPLPDTGSHHLLTLMVP